MWNLKRVKSSRHTRDNHDYEFLCICHMKIHQKNSSHDNSTSTATIWELNFPILIPQFINQTYQNQFLTSCVLIQISSLASLSHWIAPHTTCLPRMYITPSPHQIHDP